MERKMRRFKQLLDEQSTKVILHTATNGVLSLIDADKTPYGVPISFAYDGDRCIYFHSALNGHKIECITVNEQCSFCIIDQDLIVPHKFTSYFRSVIVKGKIHVISDHEEILKGLLLLCDKYSPGEDSNREITKCISRVAVLRLDIDSMTGKEAIELVGKTTISTPLTP
ncbi:MAG: pyridoxamine 5'-phosphate oxidase family protein [Muribaculaceae bacterium]|nr:pyridoxamine 5'-phosphate oxidase family protein [Muribaculaceae bacterium]